MTPGVRQRQKHSADAIARDVQQRQPGAARRLRRDDVASADLQIDEPLRDRPRPARELGVGVAFGAVGDREFRRIPLGCRVDLLAERQRIPCVLGTI
jgi:hypothetical protein